MVSVVIEVAAEATLLDWSYISFHVLLEQRRGETHGFKHSQVACIVVRMRHYCGMELGDWIC